MTLVTGARAGSEVTVSPPRLDIGQAARGLSVVQGVGSHLQISINELDHE